MAGNLALSVRLKASYRQRGVAMHKNWLYF
jgi:hypothetical protein